MIRGDDKSYLNTPGVAEHIAATGEVPPTRWDAAPADMHAHGGYGVRVEGRLVAGPFAWIENAEMEATRLGGIVVPYYPGGRRLPSKREVTRGTAATKRSIYEKQWRQRRQAMEARGSSRQPAEVLARLRSIGLTPAQRQALQERATVAFVTELGGAS